MTLEDIIPADIFVGASLIVQQGSRFLYGVRSPRTVDGQTVLELTGIGGAREEDDQSLRGVALREAREEIGSDVVLLDAPQTLIVRGEHELERVALDGAERPAAIVFRHYRTPPHKPWHPEHRGRACIAVFAAELRGRPRPAMELPYLIWLTPPQILLTARQDIRLHDLLELGAELIAGEAPPPPADCWTRLTDSQEALALALGDATLDFYGAI